MDPYTLNFIILFALLTIACCLHLITLTTSARKRTLLSKSPLRQARTLALEDESKFSSLRNRYLFVYTFVTFADWLQVNLRNRNESAVRMAD